MDARDSLHPPSKAQPIPLDDRRKAGASASKGKEAAYSEELWSAAHAEYRSGATYGKISEITGIPVPLIVARKQREDWRRDLSKEVQAETLLTLAAGSADERRSRHLTDEDVVQAAATRGAQVVQRHREVLADSIVAASELAGQLRLAAEAVASGSVPALAFLGPKETLSEALLKVGNALARIVPLERKAFGLEDGGDERPYEDQLKAWYAAKRAAEGASGG